MVKLNSYLIFLGAVCHFKWGFCSIVDDPCPFNQNCSCTNGENELFVQCFNCVSFPTFARYNLTGITLDIDVVGNFSYIPANVIYPLFGATSTYLAIISADTSDYREIIIDPEAFNREYYQGYQMSLLFESYFFISLPTKATSNIDIIEYLDCKIPYISDYAFSGYSGRDIILTNTLTESIEQNAFNNIHQLDYFEIPENLLKNISSAFKQLKVTNLQLQYNLISEVFDYSFCECNNSSCTNFIQYLALYGNPIRYISQDAFANLPNLTELDLSSCLLVSVPTKTFNVITRLVILSLQNNLITNLEPNSFYTLNYLQTLYIDYNPISNIDPGAFNGLSSMTSFEISNLPNLTVVDILITYGMMNLQTLTMSSCTNLNTIVLSDYTKLPSHLQSISLSDNMNVTTLSSDIQGWLDISANNLLDISYNIQFVCNSTIQWMTKYVCYAPQQILIDGTICASTNQAVSSYLSSFDPNCG